MPKKIIDFDLETPEFGDYFLMWDSEVGATRRGDFSSLADLMAGPGLSNYTGKIGIGGSFPANHDGTVIMGENAVFGASNPISAEFPFTWAVHARDDNYPASFESGFASIGGYRSDINQSAEAFNFSSRSLSTGLITGLDFYADYQESYSFDSGTGARTRILQSISNGIVLTANDGMSTYSNMRIYPYGMDISTGDYSITANQLYLSQVNDNGIYYLGSCDDNAAANITPVASAPPNFSIGSNDYWLGKPDMWIKAMLDLQDFTGAKHVIIPCYYDERY